ncbi:MAG: glycosyltransferase family 4 protein [Dehalococcoidia bacterium]|jgi:glycosyltransferase involved in cell wall biosynthesis
MRIAIPVFYNIKAIDGTVVRPLRIAEVFRGKHEITFINGLKGGGNNKYEDIKNFWLKVLVRILQSVWWNLKLSYALLSRNFDIVFCSNDFFGFPSIYIWSFIRGYAIIYETHDIISETCKECGWPSILANMMGILERFIVTHADYIIALSPNTFEHYKKYTEKIALVPVFIDDELFKPAEKKCGSEEFKTIGMIGPFVYRDQRKTEHLNFLYANIDKFDKRIRFVVIGHCMERRPNERIEYTGYLDSMHEYINKLSYLNAIIVPEKTATGGPLNKIIEAMACSVPVFTTPQGMIGLYWMETGKDILVFQENELVNQVNDLIFNDEYMTEVGNNARAIVEKYYSKKENENSLMRILEKVGNKG